MHKSMWNNSIVIFNNISWKEGDQKRQYYGSTNIDGVLYTLSCEKKEGEKGEFLEGIVTPKNRNKQVGTITLFKNLGRETEKDSDFKGWLFVGAYMKFDINMWLKTTKLGIDYMAGTIKIQNPEMKHKSESVKNTTAPRKPSKEF